MKCKSYESTYRKRKGNSEILVAIMLFILIIVLAGAGFLGWKIYSSKFSKDIVNQTDENKESSNGNGNTTIINNNIENKTTTDNTSNNSAGIQINNPPAAGSEISAASNSSIKSINASTALSEYGMTHRSSRMIDGNTSTAWVEGAAGQGVGQNVFIQLKGTYKLSGLTIWNGYQKNSDIFYKNSRPCSLTLKFSDGSSQTCTLSDCMGSQTVNIVPVETSSLEIIINSVYAGNKYQDTAISELSLF